MKVQIQLNIRTRQPRETIEDALESILANSTAKEALDDGLHDLGARITSMRVMREPSRQLDGSYFGPGGKGKTLASFNFAAENECGYVWEICEPGTNAEATFSDPKNQAASLKDAVRRVLPNHQALGLTQEDAAALLLKLGIIRGTGIEVKEEREDE